MGPGRGAVLLALLCLVYLTGPSMSSQSQCEVPDWDDSAGPNPFPERRGKVVLVALHKGYCGYCVQQAERLYELKNELANEGYPDIDMIIINGGETRSRDRIDNLVNASPLQVIQDTPEHVLYRDVFGASKDDFLVYDRCSQAAIYIPSPWSDLERSVTKSVLIGIHMGRHSCYCSLDYAPRSVDDMMLGDDPGGMFYQSHNMNRNLLQCHPNDNNCIQFQRAVNVVSRRNNGMGVRRGVFRRMLNSMRRRFESSGSGNAGGGSASRMNQGQSVEGRQMPRFGGGGGYGGGRRQGFGSGRRPGFFTRRRGNLRAQERVRQQPGRIAGGV